MDFKESQDVFDVTGRGEDDEESIMEGIRESLTRLSAKNRHRIAKDIIEAESEDEMEEVEESEDEEEEMEEDEVKEASQGFSEMGLVTPATRGRESFAAQEDETPTKRPRSSTARRTFSSQNSQAMKAAYFDKSVTDEMKEASVRLIKLLEEADADESGDSKVAQIGSQ
uniref:Uncharacterized protein n=1 Tax=Panagrolaimus sp. ES5 TaxID=591445 RepID=A0AC34FEH6_9BILA